MATCPAHDDRQASLSVNVGRNHPVVMHCHAGCTTDEILLALDINPAELCTPSNRPSGGRDAWMPCGHHGKGPAYDMAHRKVAEYEYRDADGKLIFAVARCALKGDGCQGFRQWRPDPTTGSGKKWSRTVDGKLVGEDLIYRLPEVLQAIALGNAVYVVEGEKDADRLWSMGVAATCNAGGAGKWLPSHGKWLCDADVVIVADRDEPGEMHAMRVAETAYPYARSINIVQAAVGKDISDHLDARGDALNAYLSTPEYAEFQELTGYGDPRELPTRAPLHGRLSLHHLVLCAEVKADTNLINAPFGTECEAAA